MRGAAGATTAAPMDWGMFAVFCAKLFAIYVVVHAVLVLAIYAIDIGCKWAIVGRRQPGLYAWEHSSYCMRWNLYLTTAVLRQHMLGYLQGSAYLVMYFRAHGAQIGRDVCLYPTGSDPMMTEPDLVSIGDNACINTSTTLFSSATPTQRAFSRSTGSSLVKEPPCARGRASWPVAWWARTRECWSTPSALSEIGLTMVSSGRAGLRGT